VGVKVKVGIPVGTSVLVKVGALVGVSDERLVAVHSGEAVGEGRETGREAFPVEI
jgi:hypothetical protein